ncbi:spindle and kinetochore-associated protein 3 isoform X2 [Engystomops pustulosus]|uniref:spindle and kinetochore-associated protein 3 isoform X2 n=1 Tax=Engystomops pustulosus TaxID=76066 RepID=UPI003AFAFA38
MIVAGMSVTVNFFSKLRGLALTLEKETAQLEQVFSQEDEDYEEECPMRVLHDLRSEIISMKSDIQATLDNNEKRGRDLNNFLKICRVLQQRNALDIQQIKETFQKYGYTPLDSKAAENGDNADVVKPGCAEESCQSSDPQSLPPPPVIEKKEPWDLLRAPQLSDFGLSHYKLAPAWELQTKKNVPEEKPKPLYKDIRTVNVAKTPKCALRMDEDFSYIEHFGIREDSPNLNDDYTIALLNKKKGSGPDKPKESSKDFKNLLTTPAHLPYRGGIDFASVDSPLPPVFCTPGLKVHKKGGLDVVNEKCGENHLKSKSNNTDGGSSAKDASSHQQLSMKSNAVAVDSPRPPSFCTPGLKTQKRDHIFVHSQPDERKEPSGVTDLDTPPVPSFETKWLKTDTTRTLDITEPLPRPELSHNLYLKESAPLDKYYENPTKTSWPPNMRDYCIGTPPRPDMTSCITEDLFKHNLKLNSPPKVSKYENMLWTPTRPEMTTCITEDISQLLSRYSTNQTKPSWQNASANKENRP